LIIDLFCEIIVNTRLAYIVTTISIINVDTTRSSSIR